MQPNGSQIKQLQQALLDAYDQAGLDRMVRIRLDADLEQLVPTADKNLTEITYALVRTCAAQPGGFRRLLNGALAENPGNPALLAVETAFAGIEFDVPPFLGANKAQQVTAATEPTDGYDVFISYSHVDSDWVRGMLLPRLEDAGLLVCIDYRDFVPGAPSVTEIERAMTSSRHTALVLTPAYLASDWANFEALLLATLDPSNRQRRLIPVLAEPCKLPPRIEYLTRVDLTAMAAAEWRRLLTALGAPALQRTMPIVPPFDLFHEEARRLDAAMPAQCEVDQMTEVRALIAMPDSDGLRAFLPDFTADGNLIIKEDVEGSTLTLTFPLSPETGKPQSVSLVLKVVAPDFDVASPTKPVSVTPGRDSGVVTFFVTPTRPASHGRIIVELYPAGELIDLLGSVTVLTEIGVISLSSLTSRTWHYVTTRVRLGRPLPPQPALSTPFAAADSGRGEETVSAGDTIIANVGDNAQQVIIGKNITIGRSDPTPESTPQPIWLRNLVVGAPLAIAVLFVAVLVFLPANNRLGWVQAQLDQRNCRGNQADETCILASRLAPGSGKASQEATRLLESSLRDAVEGSPFTVVRTRPVQNRQAALALAKRYASPLIVWGEVFDLNDLNAKVHLELVDRLGIAQSAELEPYRLQQFPVDSASITVDIPCEGEADCLGPENGRLATSAPGVARLAMGLTSYALGDFEQAKTELEPLAACALSADEPTCTDPTLLPYLDDPARSLLLYYMGRIYGFQQDYERALVYLEAARALAPDNPAPAIAAGWTYLQWSGDLVVPAEAEQAFAQARETLGIECSPNNTVEDAGERLYTLGVIHEMQEQWLDAEVCYALAADALVEGDADPYPVLINLARVQRLGGEHEAALETLAEAQKLEPNLPWAALELARLNVENETEARVHLDDAMAIAPNMLQVHTTMAELCEQWGDIECAENAYQTARTLRPDYSWLLDNMGEFYRRQEDWSRTESSLARAVALGARNPWTYSRLGFALQSQEKWPEAADAYRQAVDLAYSDEAVSHLFCPLSSLLVFQQQDDLELLQKCVKWAESEDQRNWAEQRLQELSPPPSVGE